MLTFVAYAGLLAAGCRSLPAGGQGSQGLNQADADRFVTTVLLPQELRQWHEAQPPAGDLPAGRAEPQQQIPAKDETTHSIAGAPTPLTSAAYQQTSNHSQKTDQPRVVLGGEALPKGDVVLRPGDVIEVKFFYTPELDVTQMVRPDGKIALQLVGEVTVEATTPGQITEHLLGLYRPHLKNPQITILVKSLHDRRVFVSGQVIRPGIVDMPGEMTIMEAIMAAGGFDMREAQVASVIVVRQEGDHWQGYELNMKPTLKGYRTQPFFLRPKDIVYVPRTKIAEVGQWVDEHINKLIPRLPFYFSMPLGE